MESSLEEEVGAIADGLLSVFSIVMLFYFELLIIIATLN